MRTETGSRPARTVRLADHQPPAWLVEKVRLVIDLAPSATQVRARIDFVRNPDSIVDRPDLRLDGRRLVFVGAEIDGERPPHDAITTDAEGLTVAGEALPGHRFTWDCTTEIDPSANTELEGLYISNGMYCTQCEAEGFRKITFWPDRPDVMAPFEVRIIGDDTTPVMLSNGNPVATGTTSEGRPWVDWHDPWPKPSYLFALVAGDLTGIEDRFTTASGREVTLKIWVRPGDEGKCAYAMDALKRSMRWDEETHGREYDLDLFQIVAVSDFNMGAMENKGLNVFNSKYVLASPETATDADYEAIESIVAHEYFHNWTGNRITCRDWFQLCLKEGLTVYRDQEFTADTRSRAVARINDVKRLRTAQFREDQGPLAHAVRPEEYIEINNFYTATVYEKGAEVVRMLATLVGAEGYRKALDLYFDRHDGQACTIEDFRRCFEDACGRDLTQFARWWSTAGTPRVAVDETWEDGCFTLGFRQSVPWPAASAEAPPLLIPMALALYAPDGRELVAEQVVELTGAEQSLRFEGLDTRPVPSLNRGFRAPVVVQRQTTAAEQAVLMAHDTDPFQRWEAGRARALAVAEAVIGGAEVPADWVEALGHLAADDRLDPAFRALMLEMPGEDEMARETASAGGTADPDAIHAALSAMKAAVGARHASLFAQLYDTMEVPAPYSPDAASAGRRALRNRLLGLLCATKSPAAFGRAEAQVLDADNMSEQLPALTLLCHHGAPSTDRYLGQFRARWQHERLVIEKWLAIQATAPGPATLGRVQALAAEPWFNWKNPNSFRSLIAAFASGNPTGFHAADGSGYAFLADWLIRLDPVNPQTAARVAGLFETWRRYDAGRQRLMQEQIARILAEESLSRNTREILERIAG